MRLTKVEHPSKSIQDMGYVSQKEEPNTQYEILRRRITENTQEFWYFISTELQTVRKHLGDILPELKQSIDHIVALGAEHKRYRK